MTENVHTDQHTDIHTDAADSVDNDRIIHDVGVEAKIGSIIEPVLNTLGFRLVRVRLTGMNGGTLQIMTERNDGTMTVEDCELVSRTVSPVLDVEDPISGKYHLEVSSPGIDRPLVRKSDFANWSGHLARIETSQQHDGRKKFRGRLVATDEQGITVEAEQLTYGSEPVVHIPFEIISDARLILTDDLIRDALRKDKAARLGRIPDDQLDSDIDDDAVSPSDEAQD